MAPKFPRRRPRQVGTDDVVPVVAESAAAVAAVAAEASEATASEPSGSSSGLGGGSSSSSCASAEAKLKRQRRCFSLAPDAAAQSAFAARIAEAAQALPPDVSLVASDGSRCSAHRLVLSARSPYFLKMLSSGMKEQCTGEVTFSDVDPDRLNAVLDWMYGREVKLNLETTEDAMSLLELANRWEISELCDQLCSIEACEMVESNVLIIWEAAQRMSLVPLSERCRSFVLLQLESWLQPGCPQAVSRLPANLQELTTSQFQELLDSDDLPVTSEQRAFELVLAFLKERPDLPPEEAEELLLAVRWRLVPGVYTAEVAMDCAVVMDALKTHVRPRLLEAFADGMRFQILGGKAQATLPGRPSGRLRKHHQISVPSYAFLAVYMQVRVVSDVEVLRQLCKRCAPGARLKVEWVSEMKLLAGLTCRVKQLRDEICGIQLESPDGNQTDRFLPYDALLLA